MKRALLAALCCLAAPALGDPQILGMCGSIEDARCLTATSWSVQKTALTPHLVAPKNTPAQFSIAVTEGATSQSLTADGAVTLTGLIQTGTVVRGVVVSLQKGDGQGGWTTVASGGTGDLSQLCGCPLVDSAGLTVHIQDAAGNSTPAVPGAALASLPFASQLVLAINARYDLGTALVQQGQPLRLQSCAMWQPDGVSFAPGCFTSGGGVRATRSCNGFSVDACETRQGSIQLTEQLGAPDAAIATLGAFTATTTSPWVQQAPASITAGGAAVSFNVLRSGTAGTVSLLLVSGTASCTAHANGTTSFTNTATLTAATDWPSMLGPPITGSPSRATIDLACSGSTVISVGDFCTFTQGGWGSKCPGSHPPGQPGCLLQDRFAATETTALPCGASSKGLLLGSAAPAQMAFSSSAAVQAYLPAGGTGAALHTSAPLCNPTSTSAGVLGGQLTALALNVAFSDAGYFPQASTAHLGDLVATSGACAGYTVRQILARGNQVLSGLTPSGAQCATPDALVTAADAINQNFDNCAANLGGLRLP